MKKRQTIVTNVYEKHIFVCDIKVSIEQNQFKDVVFVRQNVVSYNY